MATSDKYVIQFWSFNGIPGPLFQEVPQGYYLESFDADAHDGWGAAVWTEDVTNALGFSSARAALDFWRTQSTITPYRPDGKENRPLTAASVEIKKVSAA